MVVVVAAAVVLLNSVESTNIFLLKVLLVRHKEKRSNLNTVLKLKVQNFLGGHDCLLHLWQRGIKHRELLSGLFIIGLFLPLSFMVGLP